MVEKIEGISDKDELKRAQAAAQAQGSQVANYSEWNNILVSLEEAGVESTGSFAGDKARLQEIEQAVKNYLEEVQATEKAKAEQGKQEHTESIAKSDRDQAIKATMANATSSAIMADYMKYYHLLQ